MQLGTTDSELRFHNTGLFNIGGTGAFPERNRGIFEITGQAGDMGKFKAPTLRNIAVTAPYMHDGSLATLEDVLNFYGDHGRNITSGLNVGDGRANPHKSENVNNIKLSEQDKVDIIAFLRTLTDNEFLTNPKLSDPFKK
jgi:cytochrome c peroxidase